MGYESKLYLCEDHPNRLGKSPRYAMPIASFDLCKMGYAGPFAEMLKRHPAPSEPVFYFYGEDGDTAIKNDAYGDNLNPLPLAEVVEVIQAEIREAEQAGEGVYRRLMPCYALLAAFLHKRSQWGDLVVIHYGH